MQTSPAAGSQTSPQLAQFVSLTSAQAPEQQNWAPPSPVAPHMKPPPGRQAALVPQVQAPSEQLSLTRGLHVLPQAPQLPGSVMMSRQAPPQQAWPSGHGPPVSPHMQTPSLQSSLVPQTTPQAPQFLVSVIGFLHPGRSPAQQSWPGRHLSAEP
jgi:hypothetical protein